jgi:hypothetical protein
MKDMTPVSDGAVELRRYLNDHATNIPAFCEKHGLDRIAVQRAMNGERERVSAEFAAAIEKAAGIPARMWGERSLNATAEDTKVQRGSSGRREIA